MNPLHERIRRLPPGIEFLIVVSWAFGMPIFSSILAILGSAAETGRTVFNKNCMGCHVGVDGTDNNGGNKLHAPEETGMDGAYAARTKNKAYRTTPLRALWQHPPYFHDGSAATLDEVVAHYNEARHLELNEKAQDDLVEFLKSR